MSDPVAWQWSDFSGKWYTPDTAGLSLHEQEGIAQACAAKHGGRVRALYTNDAKASAIAGWNACRKSLYTVCEDMQEKPFADVEQISGLTPVQKAHGEGFNAGWKHAGKSIARAFCAMEAEDDNNLTEWDNAQDHLPA